MVLKVFPKWDFLGLLICCSQKKSDQETLKIPFVAISFKSSLRLTGLKLKNMCSKPDNTGSDPGGAALGAEGPPPPPPLQIREIHKFAGYRLETSLLQFIEETTTPTIAINVRPLYIQLAPSL